MVLDRCRGIERVREVLGNGYRVRNIRMLLLCHRSGRIIERLVHHVVCIFPGLGEVGSPDRGPLKVRERGQCGGAVEFPFVERHIMGIEKM